MNILMLSTKARATSGNALRASPESKNDALTRSQPGELTTARTITAKTTNVLITAIETFRAGPLGMESRRDRRPGSVSSTT